MLAPRSVHVYPLDPEEISGFIQQAYPTNYIDVALFALVFYNNGKLLSCHTAFTLAEFAVVLTFDKEVCFAYQHLAIQISDQARSGSAILGMAVIYFICCYFC